MPYRFRIEFMEENNIKHIYFTKRPIPVSPDYRPMYKIALIVIILKLCCRGNNANLLKLHLFAWALKNDRNMQKLKDYINSNFQIDFAVWTIEPVLNRALQFAVGENICEYIKGRYYLKEKGELFFVKIDQDTELLEKEKAFLAFVGKNKITDSRIESISRKWSQGYAKD
jgi:hypothetical protein